MVKDSEQIMGVLYVVATPIGNLEDISYRAIRILKTVDLVAAEDTRHTGKLFNHYKIKTPLVSCYEHNESAKLPDFIVKLKRGFNIALVSDAGTPCISDPGYRLVKGVAAENIRVIPIPGPSAVIAGLSVSGIPTDSFYFLGFPSKKKEKRKRELEKLRTIKSTLVFYESPKRIIGFIKDLVNIFGDRPAMLAREISKLHEEYLRGNLSQLLDDLNGRKSIKGECSIFVAGDNGKTAASLSHQELDEEILSVMEEYSQSTSDIAKHLSRKFNISKKVLYNRIVQLKKTK